MKSTQWYVGTLARIPTNFSTPFRVAIEATSHAHAIERAYKLYSNDVYSGAGCNISEAISPTPADADDIANARQHRLSQ